MKKTIALIGLGLIGASVAKAIKKNTSNEIYGYDIDKATVEKALEDETIDFALKTEDLKKCDYVIIALYPKDTIEYVKDNIDNFRKSCVIIDCSGTKQQICSSLCPLCAEKGLYFIGGHPMAGVERSGYKHSFAEMFEGATMILCRDKSTNLIALKAAELFFLEIGFGRVTVTDAKTHDKNIAFTSQLAHLVSSAYIKSPSANSQDGFSAGSYKDLTRVARLNPEMWTQLFLENKEALIFETKEIINHLNEYLEAMEKDDANTLCRLLGEGSEAKERIG